MKNPINPTIIKNQNRQLIYQYIRNHGPVSKRDIVVGVGLSIPTVTQNLLYLELNNYITPSGIKKLTGGRSASTYVTVNNCRLAIGVYISANHIAVASVDLSGNVTHFQRKRMKFNLSDDKYLKCLGNLVESVKMQAQISDEQLLGVGISVPSLVTEDGEKIIYGLTLDFNNKTRKEITKHIPYNNRLFHDSYMAGFAEVWTNPDIDNAFYLSLNNSIGGCIIFNKEIYPGNSNRAGEIGHMKLSMHSQKKCYCGRIGCFDTMCNANILASHTNGNLERFFFLLEQHDSKVEKVWNQYLDHLALAIHNLHLLFDFDIIVGGYVGSFIAPYMTDLYDRINSTSFFDEKAEDYVIPCKHKIEATAAGAAIRFIKDFIDSI